MMFGALSFHTINNVVNLRNSRLRYFEIFDLIQFYISFSGSLDLMNIYDVNIYEGRYLHSKSSILYQIISENISW